MSKAIQPDIEFKCGGKCCKDFTLPLSPMEVAFDLKRFKKLGKQRFRDIGKIGEMVIFLGKYNYNSGKRMRGTTGEAYHYTCKHLNKETGLCTDYENRPEMCRLYPYGGQCNYQDCECVGGVKQ